MAPTRPSASRRRASPQVADAIAGGRLLRRPVPGGFRAAAGFAGAARRTATPAGTSAPANWSLETGRVPVADPFSFTRPGQPWFAWEWLVGRAVRAAVPLARDWRAVAAMAGVVLALAATALFARMLRRGAGLWIALAAALAAASASSIHYLARPHVFSILFYTRGAVDSGRRPARTGAAGVAAGAAGGAVGQSARRVCDAAGHAGCWRPCAAPRDGRAAGMACWRRRAAATLAESLRLAVAPAHLRAT